MSIRRMTWRRRARNLRNFAKQFRQNRAGMFGLVMLSVLGFTASFAPQLAKYNPVEHSSYLVGAPFVPPDWMRLFNPKLSPNINLLNDHFTGGADGWTITANSTLNTGTNQTFSGGYNATAGFTNPKTPSQTDPGSFSVNFKSTGGNYSNLVVVMQKSFDFPYGGSGGLEYGFDYMVSMTQVNQSIVFPPVTVTLIDRTGKSYPVDTLGLYNTFGKWESQDLEPRQISFFPQFLLAAFKGSGNYTLQLQFSFSSSKPNSSIDFHANIDAIQLYSYGQTYGVMGTDGFGRDIFSYLIWGTRISFIVGLLATVGALVIGLLIGLLSGYWGGLSDELIMRATDFVLILPGLPLLIVLAAILGPSVWNIIMLIALTSWPGTARVIRSQVLTVKTRQYVEAARAIGASGRYILFRHILPNTLGLVFALGAVGVGGAVVTEAALSFLGLGDPTTPSWGQILANAQQFGAGAAIWWMVIPPGLLIGVLSISFIFIGHAMDEIFNPKLRAR